MHRRLPLGITILALVGAAFVVLPVLALVIRAPWGDLSTSLSGVGATTALRLSIEVSLAATALSLLFGVPLAWLLARGTFPGRSVLRAMVVLPIVLPPVVGGIGLLNALGRSGVAGRWLYEVQTDVNLLREQAQQARRQSPIEVLLSGLTSRTLPRGR